MTTVTTFCINVCTCYRCIWWKEVVTEKYFIYFQFSADVRFTFLFCSYQAQLQRELQKAKAEAREAVENRDRHMDDTQELTENVEMLTLDKEMAEEKAETLQLELDQAKERIEELT